MSKAVGSRPWQHWPHCIKLFAATYLVWVGCSTTNSMFQFEVLRKTIGDLFDQSAPMSDASVYILILLRISVGMLCLFLVLFRHGTIAAVIIGAQFAGRAAGMPEAMRLLADGHLKTAPYFIGVTCLGVATGCLFAAARRQWFKGKGYSFAKDVDTFR